MAPALPVIMAGLSAIGTAVSVVGALTSSKQQQSADTFNSQVAKNNATAMQEQGTLEAKQDARQKALLAGTIEANAGASGGTGSGSTLDVLGDVNRQESYQQQLDEYNASLKGTGYTNESIADLTAASNAGQSGILNAAGALGNGAVNTYGIYNKYSTSAGSGNPGAAPADVGATLPPPQQMAPDIP